LDVFERSLLPTFLAVRQRLVFGQSSYQADFPPFFDTFLRADAAADFAIRARVSVELPSVRSFSLSAGSLHRWNWPASAPDFVSSP
jgi:hypothetical protein